MKKREMKAALEALKKIRMPAIKDKALRNRIITDHLALLRAQKKYEANVLDLETVHLGSYAEERDVISELRQKLLASTDAEEQKRLAAEINGHTELLAAARSYNKAVDALGDEEVPVAGIPEAPFLEAIQEQDFDLAMIEALEPMFVNDENLK